MNKVAFVVFLVDNDRGVLKALTRLLEGRGYQVRAFSSAREFLAVHDPAVPGCIILDFNLPGVDGLELQTTLAGKGIQRPIIFISSDADVPASVKAMKAGAIDFLIKPVRSQQLMDAITSAQAIEEKSREHREQLEIINSHLAKLTPREKQVLAGVIEGHMNKCIAADLGIAEKTIKLHRGKMMQKMGVRSVAELVRVADRAEIRRTDPVARFG